MIRVKEILKTIFKKNKKNKTEIKEVINEKKYYPFENDIWFNSITISNRGNNETEYRIKRKPRDKSLWYISEEYIIKNDGHYLTINHKFNPINYGWCLRYGDVTETNTRISDKDYEKFKNDLNKYINKYYHMFTDDFGKITDSPCRIHTYIVKPDMDEFTIKLKEKAI